MFVTISCLAQPGIGPLNAQEQAFLSTGSQCTGSVLYKLVSDTHHLLDVDLGFIPQQLRVKNLYLTKHALRTMFN